MAPENALRHRRPAVSNSADGLCNAREEAAANAATSDSKLPQTPAGSGGHLGLIALLAAAWTLVSVCQQAGGQTFYDSYSVRGGSGGVATMDSRTFLHFLTSTPETVCSSLDYSDGVSPWLSRYCREGGGSLGDRLVHAGLLNGYRTCQLMFRDERWNCSFHHQFLNTGFPQAGFVWAITVSKAVEELVMACRRGQPGLECQCFSGRSGGGGGSSGGSGDRGSPRTRRSLAEVDSSTGLRALDPEKIGEKYGKPTIPTCDDNLGQASRRVRKFFGDNRRGAMEDASLTELVNFHNRRVGHLVAKNSQTQICNCLGISGSCTKRFCIRGLTRSSGHIERNLHSLFQRSFFVATAPPSARPSPTSRTRRRRQRQKRPGRRRGERSGGGSRCQPRLTSYDFKSGRSRRVKKRLLAYARPPPSFCESNWSSGYHGVSGRQCNNTRGPDERGSCTHLCCGRHNFDRLYVSQVGWCNCSMLYNPIRVHCERCVQHHETHRCR